MSCQLTVLLTDRLLCKSISPGNPGNPGNPGLTIGDYDDAYQFRAFPQPVDGLDDLACILIALEREHRCGIVRGDLTPYALAELASCRDIRRTLRDRPDCPASLADVPRSWMMVDVDQYVVASILDLIEEPASVVERVIRDVLPAEFHDATTFWQFSSTCGFRPGVVKLHLWYWLASPQTSYVLKRWADDLNLQIDRSVYQPHQIHYTAQPVLNGVRDPLPIRHGWLYGDIDIVPLEIVERSRPTFAGTALPSLIHYSGSHDPVAAALERVGDGEGREGFHAPLRRAAFLYAHYVAQTGERDDDGMIALMGLVASAAPSRDGRGQDRSDPTYLRQLITSAMEAVHA